MSVLSDRDLHKLIENGKLGSLSADLIQPASVDVRCGYAFRVVHPGRYPHIDVREEQPDLMEMVTMKSVDHAFILHPGEFVLGRTLEEVHVPNNLTARLDGKSSLGRLGLVIHSTAGWIDPGFQGTVTLELSNNAKLPITIYPEMLIGQVSFMEMSTTVAAPYGSDKRKSKYQGQTDPEPSRFHENFERGDS